MFSGRLKITVIEAKGLQLTNLMAIGQRNSIINLNPYVTIDVDKVSIDRTSTKSKTVVPTWNETYSTEFLRNAKEVGFTIFHDATMPPSSFIANCAVSIAKLNENGEAIWVSFFLSSITGPPQRICARQDPIFYPKFFWPVISYKSVLKPKI